MLSLSLGVQDPLHASSARGGCLHGSWEDCPRGCFFSNFCLDENGVSAMRLFQWKPLFVVVEIRISQDLHLAGFEASASPYLWWNLFVCKDLVSSLPLLTSWENGNGSFGSQLLAFTQSPCVGILLECFCDMRFALFMLKWREANTYGSFLGFLLWKPKVRSLNRQKHARFRIQHKCFEGAAPPAPRAAAKPKPQPKAKVDPPILQHCFREFGQKRSFGSLFFSVVCWTWFCLLGLPNWTAGCRDPP